MIKIFLVVASVFVALNSQSAFALGGEGERQNYQPQLISIDEEKRVSIIEINGQRYEVKLDEAIDRQKQEETITSEESEISPEMVAEIEQQFLEMQAASNKYTGLPAVLSTRIFSLPTDRLMESGHFGVDFTHRFAQPIKEETANDLFGFDGFVYNSIGVNYGATDWLELHALRSNATDATEVGAKLRLMKETKDFSLSHPFNVTLNAGFQNDNLQNSIDPYIQTIISRSIVPNRLQFYVSPTYAWRTNSIARDDSLSAVFNSFEDNEARENSNQGTFGLPMGLVYEFWKNRMSLVGEIYPVLSGFQENKMGWSAGLQFLSKKETHVWTLGVSNVPYSTTGQSLVGGANNDLFLGFNVGLFL